MTTRKLRFSKIKKQNKTQKGGVPSRQGAFKAPKFIPTTSANASPKTVAASSYQAAAKRARIASKAPPDLQTVIGVPFRRNPNIHTQRMVQNIVGHAALLKATALKKFINPNGTKRSTRTSYNPTVIAQFLRQRGHTNTNKINEIAKKVSKYGIGNLAQQHGLNYDRKYSQEEASQIKRMYNPQQAAINERKAASKKRQTELLKLLRGTNA